MKIDSVIDNNITVMSKAVQENDHRQQISDRKSGQTVFAGDMQGDFALQDRMQQRKELAQKRAMKVVNDAWGGDRKVEDTLQQSKEHLRKLQAENAALIAETNELTRQSGGLMTEYQIEPGSEEQQDLELLKKEMASGQYGLSDVELSEEEEERLAGIHEKGLTEYQRRALELEEHIWVNRREIYNNENGTKTENGIVTENAVIRGIREERRKVHSMVDSRKQAEEIMESAGDEIVNMAVNDAKDHLEAEQEERQEEAAEIKEEKEKQEEILEKRKEKEDGLDELMEDMSVSQMTNTDQNLSEVKRQIQNIVNEMNLVVEDIKGAQVDTSL